MNLDSNVLQTNIKNVFGQNVNAFVMGEIKMTEFMNQNTKCICCGGKQKQGTSSIIVNGRYRATKIPLIKHYVSYSPEKIAWVHYECHRDIHDGKYPHLIQYEDGESREYYDNKKM